MKWYSTFIALSLGTVLMGCRADSVELTVSYEDIVAAMEGKSVSVSFEAIFSKFGELKDEEKAQMDAIGTIVSKYMKIEDFEIRTAENKVVVTVEGEIPITGSEGEASPYHLLVTKSEALNGFAMVQVVLGSDFRVMEREMQGISFMLAPEEFHPTKFRIKANGRDIMAPAVEVDGTTYLFFATTAKERLTLNYGGGPFDRVGAGFYVRIE